MVKPLIDLTKKGSNVRKQWERKHEEAFRKIIMKLVDAVKLSHPNYDETFIICSDASYCGIGGCLAQGYKEDEKIIGYFSRNL